MLVQIPLDIQNSPGHVNQHLRSHSNASEAKDLVPSLHTALDAF